MKIIESISDNVSLLLLFGLALLACIFPLPEKAWYSAVSLSVIGIWLITLLSVSITGYLRREGAKDAMSEMVIPTFVYFLLWPVFTVHTWPSYSYRAITYMFIIGLVFIGLTHNHLSKVPDGKSTL